MANINPADNCVIVIIPDTSKGMANSIAKSNDKDINKAGITPADAIGLAASTKSDDGVYGITLIPYTIYLTCVELYSIITTDSYNRYEEVLAKAWNNNYTKE